MVELTYKFFSHAISSLASWCLIPISRLTSLAEIVVWLSSDLQASEFSSYLKANKLTPWSHRKEVFLGNK